MTQPATLTRLSVAAVVADGQRIVLRIKKSKGRERLSLWLVIQNLIWTLRKWVLPDFIDSSFVKSADRNSKQLTIEYSAGEKQPCHDAWEVWQIRVQDIFHHGHFDDEYFSVITVHMKDSTGFRRFKAFLRHLISNWSNDIKVQKLYANNTGFLVTYPAPALLYIHPNTYLSTNSPSLSKPKASEVTTVIKALKKVMSVDFYLEFQSEEAIQKKSEFLEGTSKLGVSEKKKWDQSEEESGLVLYEVFICGDKITTELLKQQDHGYLTVPPSTDQNTQTKEDVETKETQTAHDSDEWKFKNDKLMETIRSLEFEMTRREADYKKAIFDLEKANRKLKDQLVRVTNRLEAKEEELRETFLELGRASVEVTRMKNEKKREFEFDKTFKSISVTTQTPQPSSSAQAQTSGTEEVAVKSNTQFQSHFGDIVENSENFPPEVSVQESMEVSSSTEGASLTNMPTTTVERSLYNNYKLLLLTIADRLLSSDVARLKTWASSMFSADVSSDISEVFHDLDRKKVISASDLSKLREFFETILRIDLVHLIDCFLLGDYTPLRSTNSTRIFRIENRRTNRGASSAAAQGIFSNSSTRLQSSISSERQSSQTCPSKQPQFDENKKSVTGYRPRLSQAPLKTASLFASSETENATQDTRQTTRELVITDGPVSSDNGASDEVDSSSRNTNDSSTEPADDATPSDTRFQGRMGSNGNKLSKFQRADSDEEDSDDEQWLCSHYKRRCYVKFNCCNRYWPCHRCHNNESKCGKKKLKSRDTEFVKCVKCGTEQKFTSRSQFCTKCHRKFAKYFCPICKHLTGTDDNPYHCQKCGICRIHKDRSFHCDVCGVCLDVQLRGNHKCRAGSAHDECCICLEDAFTGCQILPCSHKVHKECATQMIRSGITRCPICRESFAHKLERRTSPRSKKPPGK